MPGTLTQPLAIDAMGGDHAPRAVIDGAGRALKELPKLRFVFFGNKRSLEHHLRRRKDLIAASEIIHTEDVVSATDKPSMALRYGTNTSMRLAINAVHEGECSGVVSGGNTGAFMAMSKLVLKTMPGISRPAITGLMPNRGSAIAMLDLGANVHCSPRELFEFALMGDAYAKTVLHFHSPRIGLLNIGSEDIKGSDTLKKTAEMLRGTETLNFIGFVEGNDICNGDVQVVVTDGFTGNIALKTLEGTARYFSQQMKSAVRNSTFGKLAYMLSRPAFVMLKKQLDPRNYNGAMFLGLNGIAVKSHGGADGHAYRTSIKLAHDLVKYGVQEKIKEELRMHLPSYENNDPAAMLYPDMEPVASAADNAPASDS